MIRRTAPPSPHSPRVPSPWLPSNPSSLRLGNSNQPGRVSEAVTKLDTQTYLFPSPHPLSFLARSRSPPPTSGRLRVSGDARSKGFAASRDLTGDPGPPASASSPGHVPVSRQERKPRPLTLSDRKQKTTGCPRRDKREGRGRKEDGVLRLTLERFPDGSKRGLGGSGRCARRLIPVWCRGEGWTR